MAMRPRAMRTRREVVTKRDVLKVMGWRKDESLRLKKWIDEDVSHFFLMFKRHNPRRHRINYRGPRTAYANMIKLQRQDPDGWWISFLFHRTKALKRHYRQRDHWMWFMFVLLAVEKATGAVWHNLRVDDLQFVAYKRTQTLLRYLLNTSYSFDENDYRAIES